MDQQPKTKSRNWMRRYVTLAAVVVIGYIVYLFFFSDHSVLRTIRYQKSIDSLQTELDALRDSVAYYHKLNTQLHSDPAAIEKVVRERHNMNRVDEDVYLMTPEQ